MSEYYVDPKTGEKHKWVLATDDDFEKIEPTPEPTILPALYIPGITQEPITTYSSMITPPDDDFNKVDGTYRYTGTAEYVEIPHRINNELLTSYARMFQDSESIKAVKSTNRNVKDMSRMFMSITSLTLDVSELDTSGVETFRSFLFNSNVRELTGLTNFDTSNATSIRTMFSQFKGTELDLSSFDLGKVTNTDFIFQASNLKTIYIKDLTAYNKLKDARDSPAGLNFELGGGATVVNTTTEVEEAIIPHKEVEEHDINLPAGTRIVSFEGMDGLITKTYKITTYGDGREERELINKVEIEAKDKVTLIGIGATAKDTISLVNNNSTEIYFMNVEDDRDYFVDKFRGDPLGISEQFGITLRERPNIPTAQMRYEADDIQGMPGDHAVEDNYENVEITLAFNYISSKNARETYNAVSNYLATMKPGTRARFSDDDDGTFRVLARRPSIEPLNNDLYNWGDFEIELTLEPFRYIEEEELPITTNANVSLKQPLPNAMDIPQRITHYTERNVNIETYKNGKKLYTINSSSSNKNRIVTDAELLYTYGGD